MKGKLEILFVTIVRVLFFVVALGAFVVLIASGIYLSKLYYDSFPKATKQESYQPSPPHVEFNDFESFADQLLKQEKSRKEHIRVYVRNTIKNGSDGHGYTTKNMPGKLIGDTEADKVAIYIANGLRGEKTKYFQACVACHGEDGRGNSGQSPDLYVLPIYHNIRARVDKGSATQKDYVNYPKQQRSDFDLYVDKLMLLLNKYASKTAQSGARRGIVTGYLNQELKKYNNEQETLFKKQLEAGVNNLDAFSRKYQDFVAKSSVEVHPILWQQYLKWFAEHFAEQVKEEREKVLETERVNARREALSQERASEARMKFTVVLSIAGGALLVFILATMLLILIRIEHNTRYLEPIRDEA